MRIGVALALPRDAASIPLARHTIATVLNRAGVTAECVGEIEVALSEACTNAYRHAHTEDNFEVSISIGHNSVTVDVLNSDADITHGPHATTMPSPPTDSSPGMALIAAFADQMELDSVGHDGGSVHLVKHLLWTDRAPFDRSAAQARSDSIPRPRSPPS